VLETMSRSPAWLQQFRRALHAADVKPVFHYLDRGEGVQKVAVDQALVSDVIHGLRRRE
jgi:L-lysine 2,3-aminomutase